MASVSVTQQPDELAARPQLKTWRRAAEHLNERGSAACISCELAAWLCRRGLDV
jgi:hypothetical protein